MLRFSAALVFTIACVIASGVWGADLLLTGKKMLVKSKNGQERIVLLSKDPSIPTPVTTTGSDPKIVLHPDANAYSGALASAHWTLSSGVLRYRFPSAPAGYPCKSGVIRAGLLKFVCKDTIAPLPFTSGVAVQIDTQIDRYCFQFGGTELSNTSEKFLAKNAPAPAVCPPVQSPSGAFLDSIAAF